MCPRGVTTSRSSQAKQTIAPKLWLLLVGVNQYQDEQLPSLRYSAVDCQVLAEALAGATKEQFPQRQVKIYHDFAHQLPLLTTVRESLAQIAVDAQPIDTVLFYFSGHGMLQSNTQEAFLCLADTQKDNLEKTGLPVKELLAQLSKSGAQNQLVWLDACHSGGMTLRGAVAEPLLNPTPQLVDALQRNATKGKGFYALLSCDINQQSWEFPELGHGVFTYYLMRGLNGDAVDAQGVIFADGLYRYVYHQTLQYIDKTNQQLRLINQQKRGKGDTQLFSEYPLQTPKRIVEGVGELILGSIPAIAESHPPRIALVIEGLSSYQTTLDFSKLLVDAGDFELEYVARSAEITAKDIRSAIQECLGSANQQRHTRNEEAATVLLYLRGTLEETPAGEAALLISEDIWLSRSWLRQQLRRSQIAQQIIILDFSVVATAVASLKEWVEDLQLESEKGQCIIAATSPKNNPEFFAQTLIDTLKTANQPAGLSVAGWITQLQIQLATQTQSTPFLPLHFWLSGTQGVIEIVPATTGSRSHKKSALDLKICPYRGLRAFAEEDAQYFFGRESLTQHLISQIAHKSFLAVVGASGSGKSSVVQAGLMAQLRLGKQLPGSDSWLIKCLRPGVRPLEELARRLGESKAGGAGEQRSRGERGRRREGGIIGENSLSYPELVLEGMLYQGVEGFVYWLRSRPEAMVVLVVDQFEELFTLAPSEDRQRFLELVLGAIEYAADKFKLVITLRADFIASCLEVPALASLLQESSVLVPPNLSDRDYRRVIINPAEQVSLKVEPELVEVLVQELNHSAGDLPLLEFVLDQLWEFRQEGELTLAAYQQQVGGIKGALERKAQAVYEGLDTQAQDCARWIFLSLTQLGDGTEDTRRRVLKSELVVQKYPAALVERTLQVLTAAKLVVVNLEEEGNKGDAGTRGHGDTEMGRYADEGEAVISSSSNLSLKSLRVSASDSLHVSPNASAVTIEVAHEILIRHWSTLRWWLEENRSRLRSQRQIEQAAALWKYNHEQADFLLQGIRLAEAEEIYVKYTDELSQDVQRFIAACLEERQRQQFEQKKRLRQAQKAIAVISILGIAASGLGGLAYFQKQAAQLREISALNASSEALLLSNQQLEALIASIKAGREVKQVFSPNKDIQLATVATLQQAVEQTQELNRLQGHSQQVNAVSFSPNGKIIASASDDGTIKIWNTDGKLINTITDNQNRFTYLGFSHNGEFIAATTYKIIKLYTLDGKLIKIFSGHTDIVNSVDFSPDDKTLVSASRDKTIKIWRIDGTLVKSWNGHNGWINTVSFSPDGQIIASGGEDNLVKLWQADGKLLQTMSGHKERITSIKFSPDGKIIASASGDKTIKLWNPQGEILQTIEGNTNQINSISFSPDSQLLAAGDADAILKIWRIQDKSGIEYTIQKIFKGHGAQINHISFSPDGKIIASASADKTVRLWRVNNPIKNQNASSFYSVSVSPNNKIFAAAGWDGKIKIWEDNGKFLKTILGNKAIIYAVDFSHNSQIIATASDDKTIKLWNIKNGSLLQTLTGYTARVTSISFSPDGKMLASGSADKTIKLWQIPDGKLLQTFKAHNDEITSVSFSNDSQMLASGSYDKTVKLWKLDGSLVRTLQGNGLAIASVKFSPDNTALAAASLDNNIKLWNVADGTLITTLAGHMAGVTSLSFLPNSQILASGSADGTIKLWNISDRTLLKTLLGHPGKVNSISFTPDGKALISASEDAGVKVWDLDLNNLRQRGCLQIKDYLQNNPNVNNSDRHICKD